MFPPGNATAEAAIAGHLAARDLSYADLVGPLLVPARAWDAFIEAHDAAGRPALTVLLIGTTSLPASIPSGLVVAGFELRVPDTPLPTLAAGLFCLAILFPANFVISGAAAQLGISSIAVKLTLMIVASIALFVGIPLFSAWMSVSSDT